MKQGEIVVVYRVESAQAMAAISNVQSHIKKTSDAATKSTDKITDTASKMGAGFAGTAAVMKKFGLITVGAMVGSGAAMKGFISSASDMQSLRASFVSLTGSMESAEQVMRTLYDFSKKTAFTNEQIQTTAKSFLAMGVSVKDLPGLMQDLGDIAGATGANLDGMSLQISQAFGKGKLELSDWKILSSYIGGLKPILEGVVKEKTGIGSLMKAFEEGAVSADILREALARANDEGNFAFQGAIKQSETFKGRMGNLQEQITNTGLKILGVDAVTGQIKADGIFDRVSKSVTGLTDWLSKNEETIIRVATTIQSNALPTLAAFGAAFATAKLGQFTARVVEVGAGVGKAVKALRNGGNAMKAFTAATSVTPFGLIATAIATVVGILAFLQVKFNIFGKAWDAIKAAWGSASKWFGDLFGAIGQTISNFVGSVVGFFGSIWSGITGVFNSIVSFLQQWGLTILAVIFFPISLIIGLFFTFKDQIFGVFTAVGEFIGGVFAAVWNTLVGIFTPVADFFGGIFQTAWDGIVAIWSVATSWFGSIWNGIVGVFSAVAGWFGGIFRGAWNAITGVFGGLAGWFRGVWNTVVGIFGSVGVSIGNAIGGAFKGAINGVLRFVSNMINGFIGTINGAIGIINAIPGVNIPRLGNVNIPQLAEGGIVTSATLAVIGEGSEPEAVTPLSKLGGFMSEFLRQAMEENERRGHNGGAPQINQTVQLTNGIEVDEYNASLVRQMRRA